MATAAERKKILAEIDAAVKAGDGSTIGQYLAHEDAKVQEAANAALETISQSGVEDNTPTPPPVPASEMLPTDPEARKPPPRPKDWRKMSREEMIGFEKKGLLMGYDHNKGIGLLKK